MASLSDPVTEKLIRKQASPTVAAFILLIARGLAAGAMAVSILMMAWIMPADEVGVALTLVSAAMLASIPVSLNVETGAIRFVVAARRNGRHDVIHGFLHFNRRLIVVLAGPVMLGFAFILGTFLTGNLSLPIVVLATCLIPLFAVTRTTARQAGALQEVLRGGLPQLVLRPVFVLGGLGIAFLTTGTLGIEAILLLFLSGTVLTAVVQHVLLRPVLQPIKAARITDTSAPEWALHGLRLAPSLLFQDLLRDLVLVLAAIGLSGTDAGILAVCLAIILVPNLALIAIEMGFGPPIAAAVTAHEMPRQFELLRQSALLRLLSVLPAVVFVQMFCVPVLNFFGTEYQQGELALRILCLIPLAKALFGNPTLLLSITGHSAAIFRITGQGLVLLAVFVPFAAAQFGLVGAALASVLGYGLVQYRLYARCAVCKVPDPSVLVLVRKLVADNANA